jgi:trans-aconitate methyltransferase
MDPGCGDRDTNWETASYDGEHSYVFEYGEAVLDRLDPQPDERIVDLGCGTGHLTNRIASTGADVVGVDASASMIETARETYPEIEFVRADAREFSFGDPFDAVFSNAALHWITEQDAVLDSVAATLCPGGRFVAELGGTGNVDTIIDAVQAVAADRGYTVANPWYFPTIGTYARALEGHGFEVRDMSLFGRPTELDGGAEGLASWLEMFGDRLFSPIPDDEREAVIAEVTDRLREELFVDGVWIADYRRLRVVAVYAPK